MAKKNCWEFKKCGREPGGRNAARLGVCPACTSDLLDGMNDGTNGGRVCWAVAGTHCKGKPQGTFASQLADCALCDFFFLVMREQGPEFCTTKEILEKLHP